MQEFYKKAIANPLLTCGFAFLLTFLLIHLIAKNPNYTDPLAKAKFLEESGQTESAESLLKQIAPEHLSNLELQREYISVHFEMPLIRKSGSHNFRRDDISILSFYNSLSRNTDSTIADIGLYCEGLVYSNLNDYESAIGYFSNVKNKDLKYLSNSTGFIYMQKGNFALAENLFRKEIRLKGNVSGATNNLSNILFSQKKYKELSELLNTDYGKKEVTPQLKRNFYFTAGNYLQYTVVLFANYFTNITWWGFLAAFLIMGAWVMYLRRLDFFEQEKWTRITMAVGMGMLFTFGVFPISDFINHYFSFNLNGKPGNDFLYCTFGIGAVEELMKAIPLLIMMRFTKSFNEPFDYIKFASLSALGFAFIENLEYFQTGSVHYIHARALTATVHHMFNTSIIGYGFLLNRYKWKKNPVLVFFLFYLIASVSHGFYDFWIINKATQNYSVISIFYLLFSIGFWNTMLNNALNNSSFFDEKRKIDALKMRAYLLFSLAGVVLFEFISQGILYGPDAAQAGLFHSLMGGTYLLVVISGKLSRMNLQRGAWNSFASSAGGEATVDYSSYPGLSVSLEDFSRTAASSHFLPNTGKIVKVITVFEEPDWFLISLDHKGTDDKHLGDYILIRTKNHDEYIQAGKRVFIAVYTIRSGKNLEEDFVKGEMNFCGWGIAAVLI